MNEVIEKIRKGNYNLDDKEKELAEIAVWMVEHNPSLRITGSIMLKLRGIDVDRPIHDIDLVCLDEKKDVNSFVYPPNFKISDKKNKFYVRKTLKSNHDEIIDIFFNNKAEEKSDSELFASLDSLVDAKIHYLHDSTAQQKEKCFKDISTILTDGCPCFYFSYRKVNYYIESLIVAGKMSEIGDDDTIKKLFSEIFTNNKMDGDGIFSMYDINEIPCMQNCEKIIVANPELNRINYVNTNCTDIPYFKKEYADSLIYTDCTNGEIIDYEPTFWGFTSLTKFK